VSDSADIPVLALGTSAGGIKTLTGVLGGLPDEPKAHVFVTMHQGTDGVGRLAEALQISTGRPCEVARAGPLPEPGRVVLAPPNQHLLLSDEGVHLSYGPTENHSRPAIDPFFRSVGATFGRRVIGVVLSGMLDDGTAGLGAIKRCGGRTAAEDPETALFPSMPSNAIQRAGVDLVASAADLGPRLTDLLRAPLPDSVEIPRDVRLETDIMLRTANVPERLNELGTPAGVSCPDCGGPLWRIEDDTGHRFRCHIAHGLTTQWLERRQNQAVEGLLLQALRLAEERVSMYERLSSPAGGRGTTGQNAVARHREAREHAQGLRDLISSVCQNQSPVINAAAVPTLSAG